MVELVDTPDLKSGASNSVSVRFRLGRPFLGAKMIVDMKLSINRIGVNQMSLTREGVLYFKTLGDMEGIKRCKEWAISQNHAINPNTIPKF